MYASIDQSMKPAVKMLHQKFRCKHRIIRSQETEKLPPLLFPALVVAFCLLFEIRTRRRFIASELESIDSPIMLCEPCPTTTATDCYTAKGFYLDCPQHILHPPRGGGEQRRGLMPLGLFLFDYFRRSFKSSSTEEFQK